MTIKEEVKTEMFTKEDFLELPRTRIVKDTIDLTLQEVRKEIEEFEKKHKGKFEIRGLNNEKYLYPVLIKDWEGFKKKVD